MSGLDLPGGRDPRIKEESNDAETNVKREDASDQVDRWIDRWIDGWMDGWMDG